MKGITLLGLCICFIGYAADGEPEKKPWTNQAELSAVWTGGNAESKSFGFKNDFLYKQEHGSFSVKFGGLRAENTATRFRAIGLPDNFMVEKTSQTEITAENYYFNAKLVRDIRERLKWFAGAAWERNEFSGLRNRYTVSGGLEHVWIENDRGSFKTDYGVQYTDEEPRIEVAGIDTSYIAARASYEWIKKIGKNASFNQALDAFLNSEDTDDFRIECNNGLSSSLTEKLALKIGLRVLYDNQPSFQPVALEGGGEIVPVELDEFDTVFTASLVINF